MLPRMTSLGLLKFHLNRLKVKDVLEETTKEEDAALLKTPAMKAKVTAMDLLMVEPMMDMLDAKEISSVEAITANSLDITTIPRMIAVRDHLHQ